MESNSEKASVESIVVFQWSSNGVQIKKQETVRITKALEDLREGPIAGPDRDQVLFNFSIK